MLSDAKKRVEVLMHTRQNPIVYAEDPLALSISSYGLAIAFSEFFASQLLTKCRILVAWSYRVSYASPN